MRENGLSAATKQVLSEQKCGGRVIATSSQVYGGNELANWVRNLLNTLAVPNSSPDGGRNTKMTALTLGKASKHDGQWGAEVQVVEWSCFVEEMDEAIASS